MRELINHPDLSMRFNKALRKNFVNANDQNNDWSNKYHIGRLKLIAGEYSFAIIYITLAINSLVKKHINQRSIFTIEEVKSEDIGYKKLCYSEVRLCLLDRAQAYELNKQFEKALQDVELALSFEKTRVAALKKDAKKLKKEGLLIDESDLKPDLKSCFKTYNTNFILTALTFDEYTATKLQESLIIKRLINTPNNNSHNLEKNNNKLTNTSATPNQKRKVTWVEQENERAKKREFGIREMI